MASHASTQDEFRTTRWSLIRNLHASHADSRSQLNELCLRYWTPIHQYICRRGYDEDAARKLTKGFFLHLEREGLSRSGQHSRFREFLHIELDEFLARSGEQSRRDPLASANVGAPASPPGDAGNDSLRRSFALEVVALSMARLRAEAVEANRLPMFERLQRYLSTDARPGDIEREASALGAKPLFVSMAIRRLRQRFRNIVDDELARLVTDHAELAEEREAMLAALGRTS